VVGISLLTLVPGELGGSETYVRELLRGLARDGEHDYRVLLPPVAPEGLPSEVATEYRAAHTVKQRLIAMGSAEREPFLLYPARRWPHKNHARLFEAFALVRVARPELRLVLTGGGDFSDVPDGVEARWRRQSATRRVYSTRVTHTRSRMLSSRCSPSRTSGWSEGSSGQPAIPGMQLPARPTPSTTSFSDPYGRRARRASPQPRHASPRRERDAAPTGRGAPRQ
jgi:hypothetical protein